MKETFLKIEKLNKTFGKGAGVVRAVDDVSFAAKKDEIVLIMGPSGSGKTTLLTIIGSLLSADSGNVYYGNTNITSLPKKKLPEIRSRKIGFVFQSFNLLKSLTVLENVAVVLEMNGYQSYDAQSKSIEILKELGLGDRLNYRVQDLSGGEKQRVSIARALVTNPDIVLADEPTANLDSKSGHKVMELLTSIAKKLNKAVIIVSHDSRLMDIADRVLWMEDGKLKEGEQKMVIDPVCEMKLQKNLAPFTLDRDGEIYYFCSKRCESTFKNSN
ncbi:hypothetical protein CL654_01940 [bacterium]|nr:hypothetical protein [bacterium]|tara:strand:+ start:20836 stop:21651 length:816 start_codon:yes stop_codon:yes gene_type:complete